MDNNCNWWSTKIASICYDTTKENKYKRVDISKSHSLRGGGINFECKLKDIKCSNAWRHLLNNC